MDHNRLDEILLDLVSNKINILEAKQMIMDMNRTSDSINYLLTHSENVDSELLKHLADFYNLSAKNNPTLPNRL